MQIGNLIGLDKPKEVSKKLFKLITFSDFVECMEVIAHHLREDKTLHIQLLSKDKYKFQEIRCAYFAYLGEVKGRANHDGRTVQEMHDEYKATYLIPILSRKLEWFADLVLESVNNKNVDQAVKRLITIADGSIVTTPMLKEFFKKVEIDIENQKFETVGDK